MSSLQDGTQTKTPSLGGFLSGLGLKRLSLSVAGSADVTLTTVQQENPHLVLTGALTGNINVIVPVEGLWFVFNNTSGAFSLTVKTAAGSGIAVGQGKRAILMSNGTDVVRFTADV